MAMAGWTRVEMLTRYTRVAASERAAAEARRLALMVLVGNELWNVAFFNLRSPGNGFLGVLLFLGPMLSLQKAVSDDRVSVVAWTPYTFWVIGYDVRGSTGSGV